MRSLGRIVVLIMMVCMIFGGGCAKKKVTPMGGEVVPPPPIQYPQPQAPAPSMTPLPLEMPQVQGGPLGGSAMVAPGLEDEIKTFEQNDVYFDFDQYTLTPEARKNISRKASFLKVHPELTVQVEGHCDERGTTEYNLALGERRAAAVRDHLRLLGVDMARISIISYGKERPAVQGHNEEAWAKNRRAHFDVTGG
ncbi:MAG: peptidoglycan-associated lipoprotein Pal [Syntrophaceae bacterium]